MLSTRGLGKQALRASWRGHASVKDLYCLAICHRRDVRSLRDLTAEHLPLLYHIRDAGTKTLCDVYGVKPSELRIFVHYQPQFYHFHVHFTRLHNDLGCQVERAHLLADIIATLEADGEAYQTKRTLHYQLKANDALLAKVPDLTLATDVICGFPGETEADHDATLQLVAKYKFPILNISQFYPRQGTPAAKMKRVATGLVKARTREVSALFRSYATFGGLVGTEQRCLVSEVAHDGVSLVGHTKGYVQVLLPHVPAHMGCMLRVRITEASKFYVRGDVLDVLSQPPRRDVANFFRASMLRMSVMCAL